MHQERRRVVVPSLVIIGVAAALWVTLLALDIWWNIARLPTGAHVSCRFTNDLNDLAHPFLTAKRPAPPLPPFASSTEASGTGTAEAVL
jgi:hypothetical protein